MIILYSECSSYFKTQESALPKNHDCQVTSRLSNEPPSKKPKLDIGIDSESVSDTEDETMSSQTSQTSGDDIHLNLSDDDNEADKLTGSIDCPECRKSMANLSQLYMHLRVCHDRSKWLHFRTKKVPGIQEYQCPKCYFYFSNERAHSCDKYKSILFKPRDEPDAGNEHLKADTHSICPFCPKMFGNHDVSYDYGTLIGHIKKVHKDDYIKYRLTEYRIQPFKCNGCNFFFNNETIRDKHTKSQATVGACTRNLKLIEEYNNRPLTTSGSPSTNKSPANKSPSKPLLKRGEAGLTPKTAQCPQCKFNFLSFIAMDEHYRKTHDHESYITFRRTKVQGYNEHCQVCGFYFPTEEEYYDHFGFCQDYALAGTTSGGNKRRPKRSVQTKVNFAENSDSDPEPKRPKRSPKVPTNQMLIGSEMVSKTMANPVPSNPVPVTGLGIRIAIAQPKETSNESVLCIKEEAASQSSSAVITVSDEDGSDDFHVTNDFELVSVEGCDDDKTQKNQTTKFVPNSPSSSPVQEEKKIGFAGHYSLSNRLIQPKGDMGISTLNQTISRCEPARTRTQNHIEINPTLNANNVQSRDFSPKLHKLAINDARFKCCIKSCSYVDKFKLMLRHLREGIGLIQN